jgi:hypothetical protein
MGLSFSLQKATHLSGRDKVLTVYYHPFDRVSSLIAHNVSNAEGFPHTHTHTQLG